MHSAHAAALAVLLAACSGGQTGEVANRPCNYAETVYTTDEETPLGASALELIETFEPDEANVMTWADGAESQLTLTLASVEDRGQVTWMTFTDGPDTCRQDHLVIPVEARLATDDGRIDETFLDFPILATAANEATWGAMVYAQFIDGSVDYSTFAPPNTWDQETAQVSFYNTLGAAGWSGRATLRTHQETGGDTYDDPPEVARW